jgi:hypothetical protein
MDFKLHNFGQRGQPLIEPAVALGGAFAMRQPSYVFLLGGQDEFIVLGGSREAAILKAEVFVDREEICLDPYRFVAVPSEGPNVFRMSVGS